jgi:hypothetical protein
MLPFGADGIGLPGTGAIGETGLLGVLEGKSANVSASGLQKVESHLAQFGEFAPNAAMISRLQSAHAAGMPIAGADLSFYVHELTESTLMIRGVEYDVAHAAALAKYGVSPFSVYGPEVIQQFPELFNSNWRNTWNLK